MILNELNLPIKVTTLDTSTKKGEKCQLLKTLILSSLF